MSLAVYRLRVPAHAMVPDAVVEDRLELAARRHTAAAFGDLYVDAMVWWAAADIDPEVQAGLYGAVGEVACSSNEASTAVEGTARVAPYRQRYLDIRNSRAAAAPRHVAP